MDARLGIEDRSDRVRVLTLDNPARKNALDEGLLLALREALASAESAGVRALLLRGRGSAFCAGYDLNQSFEVGGEEPLPDHLLGDVLGELERLPIPSVALVTGPAFGAGCDLAAACDFRVASPQAAFCIPPAKLGVIYAPDGLARVAALVGRSTAKLLFLTGRKVGAEEALRFGLCDELHPAEEAEGRALALCAELAANAPLAIRGMKRAFQLLGRPLLSEAERAELEALRRVAFASDDAREGRAAFLEKRPARFTGR